MPEFLSKYRTLSVVFLLMLFGATGSAVRHDSSHVHDQDHHDHEVQQTAAGVSSPFRTVSPAAPGSAPARVRPVTGSALSYRIENPYVAPGTFRKTQFHLHTISHNPAASNTVEKTTHAYKQAGYGFLMFTDHDKTSRYQGLDGESFGTATGYESTGGSGHIGAWFVNTLVDPRLPAQQRIDAIRRAGGIAVLNHPDWDVGFTAEQLKQLNGYQALEIYNHVTTRHEWQLQDNLEKWRQALNQKGPKEPVWGIAVNDDHDAIPDGGWTMVKADAATPAALREAIVRGSLYGTTGPEFRSIEVVDGEIVVQVAETTSGSHIRFIDQDGRLVLEATGPRATFQPTGNEVWVRVELSDSRGGRAWSQPMWIAYDAAETRGG